MAYQVINLNCPGCGTPIDTNQKQCNVCRRPIVITSFYDIQSFSTFDLNKYLAQNSDSLGNNPNNDALNMSQAMCKLKLKLYDDAFPLFKIAQNSFTNSEPFFYAAVSLLKGQKAFLATRPDIDKILKNLNAAIDIEPKGIYYYFLAYIKYDYFARKSFKITPNWEETLQIAAQIGLLQEDVTQLFEMLQVEIPKCLRL